MHCHALPGPEDRRLNHIITTITIPPISDFFLWGLDVITQVLPESWPCQFTKPFSRAPIFNFCMTARVFLHDPWSLSAWQPHNNLPNNPIQLCSLIPSLASTATFSLGPIIPSLTWFSQFWLGTILWPSLNLPKLSGLIKYFNILGRSFLEEKRKLEKNQTYYYWLFSGS